MSAENVSAQSSNSTMDFEFQTRDTKTQDSGTPTAAAQLDERKDDSVLTSRPNFLDGPLSDTLIRVSIANGKTFMVHKDLLSYYSWNFYAALDGRFSEGVEGKLDLNDVDERTFRTFLDWLYFEQLPDWNIADKDYPSDSESDAEHQVSSNNEADEEQELSSVSMKTPIKEFETEEDLRELQAECTALRSSTDKSKQPVDLDTGNSVQDLDAYYDAQPEAHLVDLYIFADQYDVPSLRNILMTGLLGPNPSERELPSLAVVVKAFNNLPSNSSLCPYSADKYTVSYEADEPDCPCEECVLQKALPRDFLSLLMRKMPLIRNDRAVFEKKELCERYHEHEDEDESQACMDWSEE
ncbi:MAG: hypothetical protein M1821_004815 [Bathelium mastoideum]|nr:MAG: hypothetical protein M1821_004815 [Bathelium mastoideum]